MSLTCIVCDLNNTDDFVKIWRPPILKLCSDDWLRWFFWYSLWRHLLNIAVINPEFQAKWSKFPLVRLSHCDFKLALTRKSRPCRGTFARANQADRCMNLLRCAQRSTPCLLDTRGCDREVEYFSLFERYVTLPVGTWSVALEQSFRSQCGRLLRTSQSRYFVLRGRRNKLFR